MIQGHYTLKALTIFYKTSLTLYIKKVAKKHAVYYVSMVPSVVVCFTVLLMATNLNSR